MFFMAHLLTILSNDLQLKMNQVALPLLFLHAQVFMIILRHAFFVSSGAPVDLSYRIAHPLLLHSLTPPACSCTVLIIAVTGNPRCVQEDEFPKKRSDSCVPGDPPWTSSPGCHYFPVPSNWSASPRRTLPDLGVVFLSNRAIHPQESGDNILVLC